MAYDTGATGAESETSGAIRRGPLRPSRLATARSRLGGDTLARLVQLSDLAILAGLILARWLGGASPGATILIAVGALLVAMGGRVRPGAVVGHAQLDLAAQRLDALAEKAVEILRAQHKEAQPIGQRQVLVVRQFEHAA